MNGGPAGRRTDASDACSVYHRDARTRTRDGDIGMKRRKRQYSESYINRHSGCLGLPASRRCREIRALRSKGVPVEDHGMPTPE